MSHRARGPGAAERVEDQTAASAVFVDAAWPPLTLGAARRRLSLPRRAADAARRGGAAGEDARFRELLRKDRLRAWVAARGDLPPGSPLASLSTAPLVVLATLAPAVAVGETPPPGVPVTRAAPGVRFTDRVRVVEIPGLLCEEEQVLVRARGTVAHVLGHRVRLDPHHIRAQPPTLLLQRERGPPRKTNKILRLQSKR